MLTKATLIASLVAAPLVATGAHSANLRPIHHTKAVMDAHYVMDQPPQTQEECKEVRDMAIGIASDRYGYKRTDSPMSLWEQLKEAPQGDTYIERLGRALIKDAHSFRAAQSNPDARRLTADFAKNALRHCAHWKDRQD